MNNERTGQAQEPPSQTSEEMLRQIIGHLEKTQRKGWAEVACAIILSLATTCSAWCAYQSKVWGDLQNSLDATANEKSQNAAEHRLMAGEVRGAEAMLILKIVEAKTEGKDQLAEFLSSRLFPHTQAALKAWWKADPFNNTNAPRTPFQMEQYKQVMLEEAKLEDEQAKELHASAARANETANKYILLTVLFASVLFFGGVGGTFESPTVRRVMLGIAFVFFLSTLFVLSRVPIAWS
jgi:hypothetical protein